MVVVVGDEEMVSMDEDSMFCVVGLVDSIVGFVWIAPALAVLAAEMDPDPSVFELEVEVEAEVLRSWEWDLERRDL